MKPMVLIYAFFATLGFGVLFNIERRELFFAGLSGSLGYGLYLWSSDHLSSLVYGAFLGGIVVGLLGEFFARLRKKPATIYVIPGIIPLVPGYGLYYAILKINLKSYEEALSIGGETLLVAVAIASAIIFTTTLGRLYREKSQEKYNRFYH